MNPYFTIQNRACCAVLTVREPDYSLLPFHDQCLIEPYLGGVINDEWAVLGLSAPQASSLLSQWMIMLEASISRMGPCTSQETSGPSLPAE